MSDLVVNASVLVLIVVGVGLMAVVLIEWAFELTVRRPTETTKAGTMAGPAVCVVPAAVALAYVFFRPLPRWTVLILAANSLVGFYTITAKLAGWWPVARRRSPACGSPCPRRTWR